ncbi:unnamed protein product [Xylocopa violacea]|uniref:Odorant receptor n=1 Tax=Xylocopa violacea TaxID=135666 RepID=A0ABP1NH99_XYLVO
MSFQKPKNTHMFQENREQISNAFDITYYKTLKTYLSILGINPYQDNQTSNIIVFAILILYSSVCYPATIKFYNTLREKDYDGIFEDLPQLLAGTASIIKLLNVHSNKTRFRKLFAFVIRGRNLLNSKDELYMLNKFTEQGNKLAYMYRRILITFLVLFLSVPLRNPFLDIILPLNETRPRQHIFKVNYVILDEFEYFYGVYVHLSCVAIAVVLMIVVVDSLYITIIHHACGLFAVCGYQILEAAENNTSMKDKSNFDSKGYEEFKRSVTLHHEALQFYEILDSCCRNLYLIQMGINMLVISVTAVELVMFLGRPGEAIRTAVFLIAQQIHLYVVSMPGQVLLDESSRLADTIFASKWYENPVKIQRMLYMMQIRSNKPCILTAAGLYQMKIESFGTTVKTCMSYFTMFLSLRE